MMPPRIRRRSLETLAMPRKRDRGRELHGILLLDKPIGLTSNQALQRTKHLFRAAKAGHTGSLDPLATGMLPICFGAATRVSSFLLGANKSYTVTAKLGESTDSGDSHGTVIAEGRPPELSDADIRSVLSYYQGEIAQIPPMHSALKQQGKRLYELARRGIEVERPARSVHIEAIDLLAYKRPELRLSVVCSKGTYVRTLIEDVARDLGSIGHVIALRRTAVDPFREADTVSMETLELCEAEGQGRLDELLKPVDSPLTRWPRLVVQDELCGRLSHGQAVPAEPGWPRTWVRLYDPEEVFFGIGEVESAGRLVPRRIFPGLSSWNRRTCASTIRAFREQDKVEQGRTRGGSG
jgi:tRNA pseudouridine55 synthase